MELYRCRRTGHATRGELPHPNIVNILDIDRSNPHSSSISSSSLIDIARHPIPIIFLVISSSEGPASCSFQFDHYLFRVSGFRLIAISVSYYFLIARNNRYQSSSANNDHHHQLIELETQIKIDELILAYKNILDAVYPSTTTTTKMESDDDDEDHTSISLFTEADWKTSVMDEWYDAIPLLYRRYALAQHALTMILRAFPSLINNNNHSKRNSISVNHTYQPKLIHALHHYISITTKLLSSSQASLLDHLLHSLNTKTWFEIYDDYHHKFNLNLNFIDCLRIKSSKILEIFTDIELVGFLDQTIEV
ncbi:hypothetical protein KEM48_010284 [Puccinia striiformis f. sp. tritici PST-130]|nr:hypothetical protein KEM48_010284 [Puccinia striiformis f. sp. tritici PST-130]